MVLSLDGTDVPFADGALCGTVRHLMPW